MNLSYEYKWFFSGRKLNKNDYELNYRLMDFTDSFPIYSTFMHRQNFESFFIEPYEEKTSYTVQGGGSSFSSTSIPMSRLSNRCNWCSISKRRKRSSKSRFLWSDKESNLFKCSSYSLFPWKGCSTYKNRLWYFKESRIF